MSHIMLWNNIIGRYIVYVVRADDGKNNILSEQDLPEYEFTLKKNNGHTQLILNIT